MINFNPKKTIKIRTNHSKDKDSHPCPALTKKRKTGWKIKRFQPVFTFLNERYSPCLYKTKYNHQFMNFIICVPKPTR